MELRLPPDFNEFLKLWTDRDIRYLLVGGYAVCHYGYPRATNDLDVWVDSSRRNAEKIVNAIRDFGFAVSNLSVELFVREDKIVRMGVPPMRIEIMTTITGVAFAKAYKRRKVVDVGGVPISLISLKDLRANKAAAARHKDLDDLENLPDK